MKHRTKRSEDIKTETQGEQSESDHTCEKNKGHDTSPSLWPLFLRRSASSAFTLSQSSCIKVAGYLGFVFLDWDGKVSGKEHFAHIGPMVIKTGKAQAQTY